MLRSRLRLDFIWVLPSQRRRVISHQGKRRQRLSLPSTWGNGLGRNSSPRRSLLFHRFVLPSPSHLLASTQFYRVSVDTTIVTRSVNVFTFSPVVTPQLIWRYLIEHPARITKFGSISFLGKWYWLVPDCQVRSYREFNGLGPFFSLTCVKSQVYRDMMKGNRL